MVAWVRRNHLDCFLSAVTIGEMVKGLELLPEGKKRRRLARELRFLQEDYRDRILAYDEQVAVEWGRLYAAARKQNRLLPLEDSLIEATALSFEPHRRHPQCQRLLPRPDNGSLDFTVRPKLGRIEPNCRQKKSNKLPRSSSGQAVQRPFSSVAIFQQSVMRLPEEHEAVLAA